jgi:SAM-dependent methyltransferase
MEHLDNPTAFLAEVKRVLKPNGKLIISVPNPYCWIEWVANMRKKKDTEGHISSFTFGNVDALLTFAGLRLSDMKGTYTRFPFSKRIFGRYIIMKTNNMFLTRSFMFLIEKP